MEHYTADFLIERSAINNVRIEELESKLHPSVWRDLEDACEEMREFPTGVEYRGEGMIGRWAIFCRFED